MAHSPRPDREIMAEAAVDRAVQGELIQVGEYTLRHFEGHYEVTLSPMCVRNTPVCAGDTLASYLDKENGFIVYDIGGGIGGDDSDGE